MAESNDVGSRDNSGNYRNTKGSSRFVSSDGMTPVIKTNTMKRSAERLVESSRGPGRGNQGDGNDNKDSDGDRHRDKRWRDSNPEGPDEKVYLDLMTERAGRQSGGDASIHDPELYEQFKRAEAAGIYIGPGANVVVKYRSPAVGEADEESQKRAPLEIEDERRTSKVQNIDDSAPALRSQEPVDSEIIEAPDRVNPATHKRGESNKPGNQAEYEEQKASTPPNVTQLGSREAPGSRDVEHHALGQPAGGRQEESQSQVQPKFGEWQTAQQETTQGDPINIPSDPGPRREPIRGGVRLKDILNSPEGKGQGCQEAGIREKNNEPPSSDSWYEKEGINEERRRFKTLSRSTLLRAFPPRARPTRRMRTWSGWSVESLDKHTALLTYHLPPYPQLTRPFRRDVPRFTHGTAIVMTEEDLSTPVQPKRESTSPLHSVKEAAGYNDTDGSSLEQRPTRARAARKAAIAGRQKMRESQPPPRTRTTQRGAMKRSVTSSVAPSVIGIRKSAVAQDDQGDADAKGSRPANAPTVSKRQTASRPKAAPKQRATETKKAQGRAPSKKPAVRKKAMVSEAKAKGKDI